MTETKRERMLAKIRALRAKTEASACTEHEAMAAAELASKLMADWEIEEAELAAHERRKPDFDMGQDQDTYAGRNRPKVVSFCYSGLKALTHCEIVSTSVRGGWRYTVIGDRPDRELCIYLMRMIDGAMERDYATYARRRAGNLGGNAKASFQIGMANRINERLRDMVNTRDRERAAGTGRALVLVTDKAVAVKNEVGRIFPKLGTYRPTSSAGNGSAYRAGQEAGNRVGLGRPVGNSTRYLG